MRPAPPLLVVVACLAGTLSLPPAFAGLALPGTVPSVDAAQPNWAPLNQGFIRPGNQVNTVVGQCTSNFVFFDPSDFTKLYLGVAAHCVNGMALGDPATIQGATRQGSVAYSSWLALGLPPCNNNGFSCGGAYDNDFALIRVHPLDNGRVNPAMQHFGGPTALVDSATLAFGDRVLTYGNSGLRLGIEPAKWKEGIVDAPQDGPTFWILTVTQGVPGDSGSGIMTKTGGAAGVLVTLMATTENGVVGLKQALDVAQAHAGLVVDLGTWPIIDDGLLP